MLAAAALAGCPCSLIRKLSGGAWGAWLVRGRGGSNFVLKCLWDADWRGRLASASAVVEALRKRDAPVPRFVASGFDANLGTWYLLEWLDGHPAVRLTRPLLGQTLRFVEVQAGIGDEVPDAFDWRAEVERWLLSRASEIVERTRLQSDAGARLADELDCVFADGTLAGRPSPDAVHGDFLATQLLVDDGRLAGVLDWDAAGRGERAQDLALLLYNAFAQTDRLHLRPTPRTVYLPLARRGIDLVDPQVLGLYLAHEIGQGLGFVLDHNPPHVPWRIDLGLRALDLMRSATGE